MFCLMKTCFIFSSILIIYSLILYHNRDEYLYNKYKQEAIEDIYFKKEINKSLEKRKEMTKKSSVISCYNVMEGDALPSIENDITTPNNSIFFHETSCRDHLNSRTACVIESAAKAHPNRKIYVLFTGPITLTILNETRNSISELKTYPNIVFARIHVKNYTKGTAFEDIFAKDIINTSKWKIRHTSDLIKLITMYRYGGLFLDTDTIVLKPTDNLGENWTGKEEYDEISNGVMHVAKDELGQSLIKMLLKEISKTYEPNYFIYNGRNALERVLLKFCNVTDIEDLSKETCRGFQFYESNLIYPVLWDRYKELFKPGPLEDTHNAYTFHFWNHLSEHLEVQRNSPMDQLAKLHCPVIYKLYENGDSFGY